MKFERIDLDLDRIAGADEPDVVVERHGFDFDSVIGGDTNGGTCAGVTTPPTV